jgi:NAD+ diphosphatase
VLTPEHPKYHYQFCPRCGVRGEFSEEKMSFLCSSCGFHFYLNSAAAVTGLIFNTEGELMLVRRNVEPFYGKLDLPGGFIDPGESVEEALVREIKEELGIVVHDFSFYGSFPNRYPFSGTIISTVDMVFTCTVADLSQITVNDDVKDFEFFKPEEINCEEIPFISVRNIVKRLQHGQHNQKQA